MPYVRQRGNQIAIVHGERNPDTKKVEQHILFTIYSKPEALEALGRGGEKGSENRFRGLLELEHPSLKFDWKAIRRGIEDNLDMLPDSYDYGHVRLRGRFRTDLCTFARQLMLADPQSLAPAAEVLHAHRLELEYLAEIIRWRLEQSARKAKDEPSKWSKDNPYYWRFAMLGRDVPPETEEEAAGFYERREYEKARAVFGLLIDCFPDYADGHNHLGLIALDQRRLDDAISHFEKTIEVGRRRLRKRIAKRDWWTDLDTRPYMRGLRNLALALNEAGRYEDALRVCDQLERVCGDDITADCHRASIFMNTARWRMAEEAAKRIAGLFPEENLIVAFARAESGLVVEALEPFLHGALNRPRTTRMLLGERTAAPKTADDADDHNAGVAMSRALAAYLKRPTKRHQVVLAPLLRDRRVAKLMADVSAAVERWRGPHGPGWREAFELMNHMRSPEFARTKATELADLVGRGGGATLH